MNYIQENTAQEKVNQEENLQKEVVAQEENIVDNLENENIAKECTALVVTKSNSIFVAQKMFKKSIKISIKSFLISLSLGFLNLFI